MLAFATDLHDEGLERFSKQLISRFAKPQTSGVWLPTTIQKRRGFSKYQFFCKLL